MGKVGELSEIVVGEGGGGEHKMSSDCDRVKEGVKKVKD